jgi:hypothetical protein
MSNTKAKTHKLYKSLEPGDIVTIVEGETFHEDRNYGPYRAFEPYFGMDKCILRHGMEAMVAAVKSANVRYSPAYKDESVVVDYLVEGVAKCRTRIWYQDVELVRKGAKDETK